MNPDEIEIWCPVVGFEDRYHVSNHGRVKSLNYERRGYEKILNLTNLNCGPTRRGNLVYKRIALHKNSKRFDILVHRLVMEAFIGPCPNGYQVNHIDGDGCNNHISNLEYVTQSGNIRHAIDVLCRDFAKGERITLSKLTELDIKEIRALYKSGIVQVDLAKRYKVTQTTISSILLRKTWKHVT